MSLKSLVVSYLDAISSGRSEEALAFYAPDVVQVEFPNQLLPGGATRGLQQLRDAGERGKKVLSSQAYVVTRILEEGACVAFEADWTGTLRAGVGSLKPGDTMRAHFAQFLVFENGKIVRQHTYDSFEPFHAQG
jgi:ketosteroid isomerase-like protein